MSATGVKRERGSVPWLLHDVHELRHHAGSDKLCTYGAVECQVVYEAQDSHQEHSAVHWDVLVQLLYHFSLHMFANPSQPGLYTETFCITEQRTSSSDRSGLHYQDAKRSQLHTLSTSNATTSAALVFGWETGFVACSAPEQWLCSLGEIV